MKLFLLFAFILFAVPVDAAILHGNLYEISMDKANDVIVDISTVPQQRYLAKDGSYTFKVSSGNYTVKAQQYKNEIIIAQTTEQVVIADSNDYRLDIILFPVIEAQDELLGDVIFDVEKINLESEISWWTWILAGLLLMVIAAGSTYIYVARHRKPSQVLVSSSAVVREIDKLTLEKVLKPETIVEKKELPKQEPTEVKELPKDDLQSIITFIEKDGGRTTQKELRKNFSYSEAKISLMLAELEHKGILEKIKKGRGNILILKNPASAAQPPSSNQQ